MKKPNSPRILSFDLETSDLAADVGFMLCMGYKWLHEPKVRMLRIDQFAGYRKDTTDDRKLVTAARAVFDEADLVVSWYGRNGAFDEPFLRTRLVAHGLPPLAPKLFWDGQQKSRGYLRMRNNRLANAGSLLGGNNKTAFHGPTWMRAIAGQKKALDYIVAHCIIDVEQLERVYLAMRSHMPHPHMGILANKRVCPTCGGTKLESKGYHVAATRVYQRFVCKACGAYSRKVRGEPGSVEVR